jgi:hypothetical protein
MDTEFRDTDYAEAYPPWYELHYWHRARSDVVRRLVRSVCQTGDTILEIGAGRGHYVRVLRAEGYDAFGCDLGTASVHEEVQAFIFGGRDFADLEPTLRERVTTVLLLDVLEHIVKPSDFIASVFRSLPAVQSMIITVPARQELWSNYDEHFRHFVRYDIRNLRELAERSSLSVDTCSYFFHALYAPAWLLKRIGINRRTSFATPKILWLHKLLGIAFGLESRLLPKAVYGTSLACICRPVVRR